MNIHYTQSPILIIKVLLFNHRKFLVEPVKETYSNYYGPYL